MRHAPGLRRRAGVAALALVTLLLGACASSPPGKSGAPARGGGYYLDDGPGAGPAPDLASIPDAVPRPESLLPRANRPYVVFGRQYTPMTVLAPYRERGVGSWYGRRYHGQRTSSGEIYDMYAMTAAHPTLPIPSYVRVTRVSSGASVIVRVNDRGPFLHGRLIDLSYVAAAKLGYVGAGSAEVEVELITRFDAASVAAGRPAGTVVPPAVPRAMPVGDAARPVQSSALGDAAPVERLQIETVVEGRSGGSDARAAPPMASAPAGVVTAQPVAPAGASQMSHRAPEAAGHFLQLAAFSSRENAESSRIRLARELDWLANRLEVREEGGLFKVRAGPYPAREQADSEAQRIRQATTLQPFTVRR